MMQMMTMPAPPMPGVVGPVTMAPPQMAPLPGPPMMVPLPGPPPMPTAMGMIPPTVSTLSVAIDNLPFRYQLNEVDIRETFMRWGPVNTVQIFRDHAREVGVVTFADQVDATDAQKQLTGQTCNFESFTGTLAVVMGGPEQLAGPMRAPAQMMPPMRQAQTGPAVMAPPAGMPALPPPGPMQGTVAKNSGAPPMAPARPGRPVWCCKIVIEAESLHPEFPTVTRIVGEGNANVEHIRSQTKCNLQLRGRGSGYAEPETGKELQEPMFLWLWADVAENGKTALDMTQDLLKSIYEGHQQWCEQNSIMHPSFIKPKVVENPDVLPGAIPAAGAAPGPPVAGQTAPPVAGQPQPGYGPAKAGFPAGKGTGPYGFK